MTYTLPKPTGDRIIIVRTPLLYTGCGSDPSNDTTPGALITDAGIAYDTTSVLSVGEYRSVISEDAVSSKIESGNADTVELPAGTLISPGFICAHGHFYGVMSRGMSLGENVEAPKTFREVLRTLWWRLDRALDTEAVELSTLICAISAAKSGTTTVIDHHSSPSCVDGSLDAIARGTKAVGIRASLAYEVSDRNGVDPETKADEAGIAENVRFARAASADKSGLVASTFGLHASFTLGDATVKRSVEEMEKLRKDESVFCPGFHIHVCEGTDDNEAAKQNNHAGGSAVKRLVDAGILAEGSVAGHCVDVSPEDRALLKSSGADVVWNIESNMNNGLPLPDAAAMLAEGLPCALGTDGITYDMIQEVQGLYFAIKHRERDASAMGFDTIRVLSRNNAMLATKLFPGGQPIGELKAGAKPDFVVFKYDPPTPISAGSFLWHLVFGMNSSMVRTTVCAGVPIYNDGVITGIDEAEVMRRSRESSEKRVWPNLPPRSDEW